MELLQVENKIASIEQQHLLEGWYALSEEQQGYFLRDIKSLDVEAVRTQRRLLREHSQPKPGSFEPFTNYERSGNFDDKKMGQELIAKGKVGCLIVAGGQGTRLGYDGPKGSYPISSIKHKSLFQIFCEKTLAAGKQLGVKLSLAIMTSNANDSQTKSFFEENKFFGLDPDQVSFFVQNDLPFLDQKGDLFFESPGVIAKGPDGNGSTLKSFVDSWVWEKWKRRGIDYMNFIMVDNPLADPFDAELVGYHHRQRSDVTIKCIERTDPLESVGVIVKRGESVRVVEYTEFSESEKKAVGSDGALKYPCANISIFCINMDFIHKVAVESYDLMPYHFAFKAVEYLNREGKTVMSDRPIAWKFEKFIFDFLPLAKKVDALLYPRESVFAPLKNREGASSPSTVRDFLVLKDKSVMESITGQKAPEGIIEIDQQFYYPTAELIEKWKGRAIPKDSYVSP